MLAHELITIFRVLVLLPLLALASQIAAADIVSHAEAAQLEQTNNLAATLVIADSSTWDKEMNMSGNPMGNHCPDDNASHQCGSCAACAMLPLFPYKVTLTATSAVTPYQFRWSFIDRENHYKPPRV